MYQRMIRNYCHSTIDPRHVEAWMRVKISCLDGLSRPQFVAEIIQAERHIMDDLADNGNIEQSEKLAQSYGL